MATKKESVNLLDVLKEFNVLKSVDMDTLKNLLEESFRLVIAKIYGSDENYDVIINPQTNDFEIYRYRKVVEDGAVQNAEQEIALSDARKIVDDCELDEEVSEKIELSSFGRREVLILRQTLASKILEIQKMSFYSKYAGRIGEMIMCEVHQTYKKEVILLDEEGYELYLHRDDQIPGDIFHKGDNVRAVIDRIENPNNNPKVFLSRVSNDFLRRLFELEIPEIEQGLITIRGVARIPGDRAKVAVESYDDRIDPVGSCVGVRGQRITGIVRELRGENIDVIQFPSNENTALYIKRALSPARVQTIEIDFENHRAKAFVDTEEVALAIGKKAGNINLATQLTGFTIDVMRVDDSLPDDDMEIEQFATPDEEGRFIDGWVIEELKRCGLDTGRAVLDVSREDLVRRLDLEEETIDNVLEVIRAEFDKDVPVEE